MRVLVTNDDGIDHPGLLSLASAAVGAGHEVAVLAPEGEMSGSGAAMGSLALQHPLELTPRQLEGLEGVRAYSADTTPGGCVILAFLGVFGPPPDLVLSGVNNGWNVGRSTLHSGTLGAALTAYSRGGRGLAVSSGWHEGASCWGAASSVAVDVLEWFMSSPHGVLNMNVPNTDRSGMLGFRWAPLAPVGSVRTVLSSFHDNVVYTEIERTDPSSAPPGSDRDLVEQGWVTLTSISGLAAELGDGLPPSLHP